MLLCPFVGKDDLPRCIFWRRNYDLSRHILELSNVVSFYVLILNLENSRVRPFTFCAEPYLSHDCRERVCADVTPDLGIIERLRRLHCLFQYLKLSVGPGRHIISQRIHPFGRRSCLITRNEIAHAGELHPRHRQPELVVDETIEQRSELRLDGRGLTVYGYARVSTRDQDLIAQDAELRAAGCAKVFKEKISGAKTDRPELAKVIRRLEPGDVLLVTRLDRLARSPSVHISDDGMQYPRRRPIASSIMGFEDEVEQSFGRPCRQCDCRFKRPYELTSPIVPRGTSFHRSVELECPSIGLDAAPVFMLLLWPVLGSSGTRCRQPICGA